MAQLQTFIPDLIIEVTSVCNRSCSGCYAPNLLSKRSPAQLLLESPELFLSPSSLASALATLGVSGIAPLSVLAIRGGEPSLHPQLEQLLRMVAPNADHIYLETHARWLLAGEGESLSVQALLLLEACRQTGVQLKISFDRMHGLSLSSLKEMIRVAEKFQVRWCIAITETRSQLEEFMKSCSWLPMDRVFFQEKAFAAEELVLPHLGVIHTNGSISKTLNSRFQPKTPLQKEVVEKRC